MNTNYHEYDVNSRIIMRQFAFYFYEHNNAGLLFLLVVVGVVDAFHKDFAVGNAVAF